MNENQFAACFNTEKYAQSIKNGIIEANKKGVTSTPIFFVNDKLIRGAKSFAEFKKVIDSELEKMN